MTARYLKILLTLCVAGLAGLYAIQNIVNLDEAHGFAMLMLSQSGEGLAYPDSIIPSVASPAAGWAVLWMIIAGELLTALFALWGAAALFGARGDASAFNAAKGKAMLGAGLGIFVWFGFFAVIGGAGLQMWQTPAGGGSLQGAFQYSVLCFLTLLFLGQHDR